jgi:dipeptidase D
MSPAINDVVQTSTNLAILRINEGKCEVQCLLRSSDDNDKKQLTIKMEEIFRAVDARSLFDGDYPGWNPDPNSFILSKARETYKNIFGPEPLVKVIHAGLECGIIGGTYPGLDMVSFGPTIMHPHSPDEKVHIQSVERFWIFLKELLQKI